MTTESENTVSIKGVYYALSAFTLWGFLPLFWKMLGGFDAGEVLANRIIWSAVFVTILLISRKEFSEVGRVFRDRKRAGLVLVSSLIISSNWFVYIWAVQANHVIEASMGYYINPLIVILMGTLILKEKLNRLEVISIGCAAAGVLFMTIQYGRVPWISLYLATSFSLYGLCKKMVRVDALAALGLETLMISPVAIAFLFIQRQSFLNHIQVQSIWVVILLMCSGVFTALPLLWFARAARLVPLSVLGFAQYLAPTFMLLLGVFLFKEPFTRVNVVSFSLIWTGLAIFSIAQTRKYQQAKALLQSVKKE